jgi:DNA invertase Pin-like site-specific DNA recombinase
MTVYCSERASVQARAAKEAQRMVHALAAARARELAEEEERQRKEQLKAKKRKYVANLLPPGMSVREGLRRLNFPVGEGLANERRALKQAHVHYHPDTAIKRNASLEECVEFEEIFKALKFLRAN